MRDRLVAAVLKGDKTATTSLLAEWEHDEEPLPAPGARQTVVDSDGHPVAVIELIVLEIIRLGDADLRLAVDEGEGFASVTQWREVHEQFWKAAVLPGLPAGLVTLCDETPVVVERFRLLDG